MLAIEHGPHVVAAAEIGVGDFGILVVCETWLFVKAEARVADGPPFRRKSLIPLHDLEHGQNHAKQTHHHGHTLKQTKNITHQTHKTRDSELGRLQRRKLATQHTPVTAPPCEPPLPHAVVRLQVNMGEQDGTKQAARDAHFRAVGYSIWRQIHALGPLALLQHAGQKGKLVFRARPLTTHRGRRTGAALARPSAPAATASSLLTAVPVVAGAHAATAA